MAATWRNGANNSGVVAEPVGFRANDNGGNWSGNLAGFLATPWNIYRSNGSRIDVVADGDAPGGKAYRCSIGSAGRAEWVPGGAVPASLLAGEQWWLGYSLKLSSGGSGPMICHQLKSRPSEQAPTTQLVLKGSDVYMEASFQISGQPESHNLRPRSAFTTRYVRVNIGYLIGRTRDSSWVEVWFDDVNVLPREPWSATQQGGLTGGTLFNGDSGTYMKGGAYGQGNGAYSQICDIAVGRTRADVASIAGGGSGPTVVSLPAAPANARLVGAPGDRQFQVTADPVADLIAGDGYQHYVGPPGGADAQMVWDGVIAATPSRIITKDENGAPLVNGVPKGVRIGAGGSPTRPAGSRLGPWSNEVVGTPQAPPTSAPAVPTGLAVDSTTTTTATLRWNPNTDVYGRYNLYLDGVPVDTGGSLTATTFTLTGLEPGRVYQAQISAGGSGAESAKSAPVTVIASGSAAVTIGSISDLFNAKNEALWTWRGGMTVAAGELLVQPPDNVTGTDITTADALPVAPGDTVWIENVRPWEGTAGGVQAFILLRESVAQDRLVARIANGQLVRRLVWDSLAASAQVEMFSKPYDPVAMVDVGIRAVSMTLLHLLTRDAAGTETVQWVVDLAGRFTFEGKLAEVQIGATMETVGSITTPTRIASVNAPVTGPGEAVANNIDNAHAVEMLDWSLGTNSDRKFRLCTNVPSDTVMGTPPVGMGYADLTMQFDAATAGPPPRKLPKTDLTFGAPTGVYTVKGYEVWDNAMTKRLWWTPLPSNQWKTTSNGGPAYRIVKGNWAAELT